MAASPAQSGSFCGVAHPGGHYAAVKKNSRQKYKDLRTLAEGRTGRNGTRLKLRYFASLQLPALAECDEEARAQERLAHVLYAKKLKQADPDEKGRAQKGGTGRPMLGHQESILLSGSHRMVAQRIGDKVHGRKALA